MNHLIQTLISRKSELLQAFLEHIQLSLLALFIAILIAIPLAIFLTHHKKIAEIVLQVTGIFQTIPSLALLGVLIPLIGIGRPPAVVALVIYAIFPIVQNTYAGLTEIDRSLEEAAEAFGMTKREKLLKFQLQLASPYIISGIRTATVLIIGTATLAALIGAGGLGTFILLGIDRNNLSLIIIGAVSSAMLAVIFNYGIRLLGKADIKRMILTGLGILFLLIGSFFATTYHPQQKQLIIAGKLGAEPDIIIHMYKELIEDQSDIAVKLKPHFGKTSFLYEALKSEKIDLYPEYTGTVLSTFLNEEYIQSNNPETVYQLAKKGLVQQDKLIYLEPMAFQNTYAVAVKREFADKNNLQTIADLHRIQNQVKAGFTLEFIDRWDGYQGMKELYGLNLEVISMEPALRYQAINNGEINVIDAYSTDSEIKEYDLVILKDSESLFPPYQCAPLLRQNTLEEMPKLETILKKLAGKVTEKQMIEMNYQVNVLNKEPSEVAHEFLSSAKLLKEKETKK